MTADQTRSSYARVSRAYIDRLGDMSSVLPEDRAFIAGAFRSIPARILDAGCGPGHLTAYLHSLDHDVSGMDLVDDFVIHAQRSYPQITFSVGDVTRIDDGDEALGGVLAWYSLIHMSDEELTAALAEFHRVLMPGGILVLGMFHATQRREFDHRVTPATARSEDEVEGFLDRAGFSPLRWEARSATPENRAHLAVAAIRVT